MIYKEHVLNRINAAASEREVEKIVDELGADVRARDYCVSVRSIAFDVIQAVVDEDNLDRNEIETLDPGDETIDLHVLESVDRSLTYNRDILNCLVHTRNDDAGFDTGLIDLKNDKIDTAVELCNKIAFSAMRADVNEEVVDILKALNDAIDFCVALVEDRHAADDTSPSGVGDRWLESSDAEKTHDDAIDAWCAEIGQKIAERRWTTLNV